MIGPDEIRDALDGVAREVEAENLRADVRQLAGRLAACTVDGELAADLLEVAARIMRAEQHALTDELRAARDQGQEEAAAAYAIGRCYAYSLAECRLPRAALQARRIHGLFRDPDSFLDWEKERLT